MKTHNSKFVLIAILVAGWITSGCGASQSGTNPTSYGTLLSPSTLATSAGMASCNKVASATTRLNASLKTVDGNPNMMRVRITGITSQYDATANSNLQFFRWKVVNGVSQLDSTPLTFHIETPTQSGAMELSNNMTGIAMTNLTQIASSNFMSISSAEQFFNQVDIVVHNVTSDYQVLKIALYAGTSLIASDDALLPSFAANPVTYDTSHASVLNSLHPFANQLSYTDAQYTAMAQSYCF